MKNQGKFFENKTLSMFRILYQSEENGWKLTPEDIRKGNLSLVTSIS